MLSRLLSTFNWFYFDLDWISIAFGRGSTVSSLDFSRLLIRLQRVVENDPLIIIPEGPYIQVLGS